MLIIIKNTAIEKNAFNRFRAFPLNILYTLTYARAFTPAFQK